MEHCAVMIGRFQPFHNGHENIYKSLIDSNFVRKIIFVIGSNERDGKSFNNPFTADERIKMITRLNLNVEILVLDDNDSDIIWMENLIKLIDNKTDLYWKIYTDNKTIINLFDFDRIFVCNRLILCDRRELDGNFIRKTIVTSVLGINEWKNYLNTKIISYIEQHGTRRLVGLYDQFDSIDGLCLGIFLCEYIYGYPKFVDKDSERKIYKLLKLMAESINGLDSFGLEKLDYIFDKIGIKCNMDISWKTFHLIIDHLNVLNAMEFNRHIDIGLTFSNGKFLFGLNSLNGLSGEYLFHGTNLVNLPRLLVEGFKLPMQCIPEERYLLGRGIYFSPVIEKAVRHCRRSSIGCMVNKLPCVILLCRLDENKLKSYKIIDGEHDLNLFASGNREKYNCFHLVAKDKKITYDEIVVYDVSIINICHVLIL